MSDAADFRRQLGQVPAKLFLKGAAVQLDATMMAYEAIAKRTAVDTGFLRASLTATAGSEAPGGVPARDPNATYTPDDGSAAAALAKAAKAHAPVTIGYQAEYAPYEEDRKHMVAATLAEWPGMVEQAVRNAGGGK